MTTPLWTLLGFTVWTLLLLFGTVGVYRWAHILTGREAISRFRADAIEGADWYKRAMRAHANCVENLPVYGAIVLVAAVAGIDNPSFDLLALGVLGARIVHSLIHVALVQTDTVSSLRFAFFLVQAVCMLAMAVLIATAA